MVPVELAREIAQAARELICRASPQEFDRLLTLLLNVAWPSARAQRS